MEDEKETKKKQLMAKREALESKRAQSNQQREETMKSDARLRAQFWADNIIKDICQVV
jgi:hypothetical protein